MEQLKHGKNLSSTEMGFFVFLVKATPKSHEMRVRLDKIKFKKGLL